MFSFFLIHLSSGGKFRLITLELGGIEPAPYFCVSIVYNNDIVASVT